MEGYVLVCTGMCWYILVHTTIIYILFLCEGLLCVQDTIVVIPPYPYSITEDIADLPFKDCWYASPQLFFQCYLRPSGGRQPKNQSYKIGPDDLMYNLVFFSTFEELELPIHGPMEDAGILKLY